MNDTLARVRKLVDLAEQKAEITRDYANTLDAEALALSLPRAALGKVVAAVQRGKVIGMKSEAEAIADLLNEYLDQFKESA